MKRQLFMMTIEPRPSHQEILNALKDLILVKGSRSELLWANKAFLEYYGCTLEELVGSVDAEHSDPDDTVQYVKDDRAVFTSGRTLRIKEPVTCSNSEVGYFDTVKSPIRREGKVVFTVGSSRPIEDVEKVEEFEKELRLRKASLRELRTLVAELPMPMAMLDVHCRIVSHSRAWVTFWNESEDELAGESIARWDAQLPLTFHVDRAISEFEKVEVRNCQVDNKHGGRLVNVVVQPWNLRIDEVGGAIVLLEDITQAREYERQLELQTRELQRRNEDLDQFVQLASHDLKAPLRGIKNIACWLQEDLAGSLPEASESHLKELSDRVGKMEKLLAGLLKYSRAGRESVSVERFTMGEVFENLRHAVSVPEGFTVKTKGDDVVVKTVRLPLMQTLQNLFDNAIRHHNREDGTVELSAASENGILLVTLKDDGPGVDPKHHHRIFEMFQTLDASRGGDGVGLALVKRLAAKCGGTVEMESEQGKGTTMTVRWPIR